LTTVRQPIYEIGKMLSQTLVKIIEGNKLAQHQLLLGPELVIRESSGGRLTEVEKGGDRTSNLFA
jgi:DNA-binding LacI/PurR family transcriptional regulator